MTIKAINVRNQFKGHIKEIVLVDDGSRDKSAQILQDTMLPHIFAHMEQAGWPTCPYVNPVKDSPDHGIAEFLEVPPGPGSRSR